jgi:pantothenate kinase-related protein Tda10
MTTIKHSDSNAFYKQKGLIRYIFVMRPEFKAKIDDLSKTYKITQGEVIETLLEQETDSIRMRQAFRVKSEAKVRTRAKRSESTKQLINDVADLTPEQLAAVQETIASPSITRYL